MSGNFRDTKLTFNTMCNKKKKKTKRKTKIGCFVSCKKVHSFPTDVQKKKLNESFVNSFLSRSFLIKFSSLSAPTKIEELTAGSDEKQNTAQARVVRLQIRKTLGSIPGGAALCFFV